MKGVTTDIDEDLTNISSYLINLNGEQLKTLGQLLGLSYATITNCQDTSVAKYRESILSAWLLKQDKVTEKGGPYWSTLEKALRDPLLRQNGIADKIHKDKLNA